MTWPGGAVTVGHGFLDGRSVVAEVSAVTVILLRVGYHSTGQSEGQARGRQAIDGRAVKAVILARSLASLRASW